jgi:hypothetical protein
MIRIAEMKSIYLLMIHFNKITFSTSKSSIFCAHKSEFIQPQFQELINLRYEEKLHNDWLRSSGDRAEVS